MIEKQRRFGKMKEKILYLIIGILIGAVITAGCFLVFSNNKNSQEKGGRPDRAMMDANMIRGENVPEGNMPRVPSSSTSSNNTL